MPYGSLNNLVASRSVHPQPVVGMPATMLMWSDRHPATVIAISPSGKTVTVQMDRATRVDKNGMSESQEYTYERDPLGRTYNLRLTRKGWACKGQVFALGYREEYHDYSF